MYRFLLSPRWLGLALLMALAAATMVGLGLWQLDRFHYRSGVNARIDSASANPPLALGQALTAPPTHEPGSVGPVPAASYARVTATGRYDAAHEILVRARTVDSAVGFEILTPLVLADGTAVLVDRGWLPPAPAGAAAAPTVPAVPTGEVTVIARVHAPESRASGPEQFAGRLSVRRIDPAQIAPSLPYPVYGGYLTVDEQRPAADPAFVPIAPTYENAAMNAGYVVQWWMFALLTVAGYVVLAIREARGRSAAAAVPVSPALVS